MIITNIAIEVLALANDTKSNYLRQKTSADSSLLFPTVSDSPAVCSLAP